MWFFFWVSFGVSLFPQSLHTLLDLCLLTLLPVLPDLIRCHLPWEGFVTIPLSPPVRVSSSLMSPEKYPADPAVLALLTLRCNCSFASVSLLLDCELPEGRNAMFFPWLFLVPSTEPGQKESQQRIIITANTYGVLPTCQALFSAH